jgi:hypothetical protein
VSKSHFAYENSTLCVEITFDRKKFTLIRVKITLERVKITLERVKITLYVQKSHVLDLKNYTFLHSLNFFSADFQMKLLFYLQLLRKISIVGCKYIPEEK